MNFIHRRLCRSARWNNVLKQFVVPWVLDEVNLGDNVLEVGPGPGLTTDLLRAKVSHLTALEIDAEMAQALTERLQATNVKVVRGDATAMRFEDDKFSGAVSFTMLHHVASPALQDKLLREVRRVLAPGGVFAGTDSLMSWSMHLIHIFDTLTPVDPKSFGARLEAAGFENVLVETNPYAFRFRATKPA
ncbi:MAG: class I SAM-dependent methyltransferase [Deltaproteobacteria bacterium]